MDEKTYTLRIWYKDWDPKDEPQVHSGLTLEQVETAGGAFIRGEVRRMEIDREGVSPNE